MNAPRIKPHTIPITVAMIFSFIQYFTVLFLKNQQHPLNFSIIKVNWNCFILLLIILSEIDRSCRIFNFQGPKQLYFNLIKNNIVEQFFRSFTYKLVGVDSNNNILFCID